MIDIKSCLKLKGKGILQRHISHDLHSIDALPVALVENKKGDYQIATFMFQVENTGFEPVTSCMPCKRSTN